MSLFSSSNRRPSIDFTWIPLMIDDLIYACMKRKIYSLRLQVNNRPAACNQYIDCRKICDCAVALRKRILIQSTSPFHGDNSKQIEVLLKPFQTRKTSCCYFSLFWSHSYVFFVIANYWHWENGNNSSTEKCSHESSSGGHNMKNTAIGSLAGSVSGWWWVRWLHTWTVEQWG